MASSKWGALADRAKEAPGFQPAPAGPYELEVDTAEFKQASTGKDMFVIIFKIVGGPSAGKKIYHNMVISPDSPAALSYFFDDMAKLGVPQEFITAVEDGDEGMICAKLIGAKVNANVGQKEFGGNVRNEIKKIEGVSGPTSGPTSLGAPSPARPQNPFG